MSPDTRPDPLADLLPIIDAAEAAVAAGALPVDVLNITQPVRYAIAHAGVTLTQPQPDAGLRDDLRGLLHEISGDLDARADSGDDISRDLGDRLRAALRSTPAAPHLVIDDTPLYLVCGVCGNADEGGHRGEYLHDFIPAGRRPDECDQPPEGWYCTRTKGHDGPCAALRSTPEHEHAWSTTFGTGPDWWEHCATCGPSVSRHVGPDEEGADRGQD